MTTELNPAEAALAPLVDAFLCQHFADHTSPVINPAEWHEAVIKAVMHLRGATPLDDWLLAQAQLEATLADLRMSQKELVNKATFAGRAQGNTEAIQSLQSFCDSEPTLGEADKKDLPGVRRAIDILTP